MTTLTLKREQFHFEDIFKMQQAEGNKDLKLILQFPGGFTQEVLTTNKMFNLIKSQYAYFTNDQLKHLISYANKSYGRFIS